VRGFLADALLLASCFRLDAERRLQRHQRTPLTARVSGNLAIRAARRRSHGRRKRAPAVAGHGAVLNLAAFTLPLAGSTQRRPQHIPGSSESLNASSAVRPDRRFARQVTVGERKQRVNHTTITNIDDSQLIYVGFHAASQTRTLNLSLRFNY